MTKGTNWLPLGLASGVSTRLPWPILRRQGDGKGGIRVPKKGREGSWKWNGGAYLAPPYFFFFSQEGRGRKPCLIAGIEREVEKSLSNIGSARRGLCGSLALRSGCGRWPGEEQGAKCKSSQIQREQGVGWGGAGISGIEGKKKRRGNPPRIPASRSGRAALRPTGLRE